MLKPDDARLGHNLHAPVAKDWPLSLEKTETPSKDDLKPAVETMLAVATGAAVSRLLRLAMTASRRASRAAAVAAASR